MTGGTVFVYRDDPGAARPHKDMVEVTAEDADAGVLRDLLERHHAATNSQLARELVASWPQSLEHFVKFAPAAGLVEQPVPVRAERAR